MFLDQLPRNGRVCLADSREKQFQVVVNLRRRANGGTRVTAAHLLLNGNGGRNAFNIVGFGLVDTPQKLPRVCRQALNIAALPFGVERVERQRRLAAAR